MGEGPAARVVIAMFAALLVAAAPADARQRQPKSPFAWRGIVEGPYGPTWTHDQRTRVLRWMPSHGFNAYVHAPKNELFQRTNWRDPYPAAEQTDFEREIRDARARGVEWVPNLSPAVPLIPTPAAPDRPPSRDLCFSCPADLDVVVAKLEPFYRAGVRTFMISFDDVAKVMTHPEDLARYGLGDEAFGRANGEFLSRLHDTYLRRGTQVRLLTVGADYSGTQDTAYLHGLRATLRPEVEVMWTGTGVPSQDFTAADARAYGAAIGRKPLVWDNWTNNDTAGNALPTGPARIFLGPYKRRPEVAGELRGFFFNPMNEADLNLLPLATAGDWMRSPTTYDRRRSWLGAVRELTRRRGSWAALYESLRAFAETSWSTKLDPDEAPTFGSDSERFLRRIGSHASWRFAFKPLVVELARVQDAGKVLTDLPNRAFAEQAKPFLESASSNARAGHVGTDLLAAERPSLSAKRTRKLGFSGTARPPDPSRVSGIRSDYSSAKLAAKASPRFTYGWRGGTAFEIPPYAVPRNVMDEYLERVDGLDGGWDGQKASASVTLALNGAPVELDSQGAFRLPASACGGLLQATDGAGGRNAIRLARCRQPKRR